MERKARGERHASATSQGGWMGLRGRRNRRKAGGALRATRATKTLLTLKLKRTHFDPGEAGDGAVEQASLSLEPGRTTCQSRDGENQGGRDELPCTYVHSLYVVLRMCACVARGAFPASRAAWRAALALHWLPAPRKLQRRCCGGASSFTRAAYARQIQG
ncbi:hypothetical protein BDY21DRAFT_343942 [Lineolata rhizophorae]|uniref:Uncharacterized protein n=1 Tax=Lineolata rhizophorae TaxID=578093 RepID=A0A6A6P0C0_9PEZI|nr:hypothetical protein BDY21DRAFT_343942 [Lineolata rhizophorae]